MPKAKNFGHGAAFPLLTWLSFTISASEQILLVPENSNERCWWLVGSFEFDLVIGAVSMIARGALGPVGFRYVMQLSHPALCEFLQSRLGLFRTVPIGHLFFRAIPHRDVRDK